MSHPLRKHLLLVFSILAVITGSATVLPAIALAQQEEQEAEPAQNEQNSGDAPAPDRRGRLLAPTDVDETQVRQSRSREADRTDTASTGTAAAEDAPNEFETYVRRVVGRDIERFGKDLVFPDSRGFALPPDASVPPDYRVSVGDVIAISLAGAIEGSFERTVDRDGKIFLPSVGTVKVAGVRQGDLRDFIAGAVGTQFRNFRVGVRISELNGIRVYVTGFAREPGSYTVSNLSTVVNALLQAGGPSAGGSFRNVTLLRDGQEIARIDLYDLLLRGDRSKDAVLENGDVIFVSPLGQQVAVIGSVNKEAIYELAGGETVADLLALAGGPSALGESARAIVYRANDGKEFGPVEVEGAQLASTAINTADIIQVLPKGSLIQPRSRQSIVVTIEGEVMQPGNYFLPASASIGDIVSAAGGLTPQAFAYGTVLTRQSIREQQAEGFAKALDQFETALATAPLNTGGSIDQGQRAAQLEGARATLQKLRETEPDGRLVLDIEPSAGSPPPGLALENGDRLYVPARPSSVGVYGAVYRPASFQLAQVEGKVRDYVRRSGGAIRGGDTSRLFVIRANGEVLPKSQGALNAAALPGDVVFVPVKTSSTSILDRLTQFATIVFQFGIAAATVAAID